MINEDQNCKVGQNSCTDFINNAFTTAISKYNNWYWQINLQFTHFIFNYIWAWSCIGNRNAGIGGSPTAVNYYSQLDPLNTNYVTSGANYRQITNYEAGKNTNQFMIPMGESGWPYANAKYDWMNSPYIANSWVNMDFDASTSWSQTVVKKTTS